MAHRPFLILIVIDGFGCRAESQYNAIASADTPRFDALYREQAWTTLEASGLAVGLPEGQMGNSEVGHLNIGAGRVVDQDIVRISKSIRSGELAQNEIFVDAVKRVPRVPRSSSGSSGSRPPEELRGTEEPGSGRNVHFTGLLSNGGV